MADHIFVAKAAGTNPEKFLFITLAEDYSRIVRTSGAMSEDDMRGALRKVGMPEPEINSHIDHARKHPT